MIPLPKDEVTPPVTKIYLAEEDMGSEISAAKVADLGNSKPRSPNYFVFGDFINKFDTTDSRKFGYTSLANGIK